MKRPWRRWIGWASILATILIVGFTVFDLFNTAGDIDKPDLQLKTMSPAERDFCLKTLWRIDSSSTERDVLALLGPPSRSLKYHKTWWVNLDGRASRAGVFFNTAGFADEVVLDGGVGRFYYRRRVKDHEAAPPSG